MAENVEVADDHVAAEHRVHLPEGRPAQPDAFDQHILACIGLDETRPQIRAVAEDAFLDGNPRLGHLEQLLPRGQLVGHPLTPAAIDGAVPRSFPRPPMLGATLPVEGARSGDGDILLAIGVDEGRIVEELHPLPACQHDRVMRGIGAELERRAFGEMQLDIGFEAHRAGGTLAIGRIRV